MDRRYITVLLTALLCPTVNCGDGFLFPPDPLHLELVRMYSIETGWADNAFASEFTCIRVTAPLCRCEPENLGRIVAGLPQGYRVDINTAPIEELTRLPGIGPGIATRIIAYREEQPFDAIEDLMQVNGIGPGRFGNLAHLIRVSSATRKQPGPEGESGPPKKP